MSDVVGVPLADQFPDSPAGRQARWFLDHVASDGVNVTLEEVAEHMALPAPWTPSEGLERFRTGDRGTFKVDSVVAQSATEIDVILDYRDGKPRKLSLFVSDAEPHRIVKLWWARAMADDIVIRRAVADDSAALTRLEVRAPMKLGAATKLVYDRGGDFLAFSRLMEESACFVAERDDELLGIACGARHPVRIGGEIYTVMLLHHVRIPVEHRNLGLFSALNNHVFSAFDGPFQCAYGYRAVDNADAERIRAPRTWNAGVFRGVIDCAAVAGADHGRPVTPADAPVVVDILNRGHAREELFLPYTEASLTARLERAPDLYTWKNLRIADGSVLGVWRADLTVTVDDGTPVRRTRSVTLDHGFVEGAADEFERLLRGYCRELLQFDYDELTLMTSEGSPNYELTCKLAHRMDPFAFNIELAEPPGTIERGLYIDAVYF
jgi:hypothetical protein